MLQLYPVFTRDSNGRIIAEIPDIPGAMTVGKDRAQALERIQDAIWIVLSTSVRERLMRPEFGAGAHDFVFSNNSDIVRTQLSTAVKEALLKWEPRIDLQNVSVQEGSQPSQVLVSIDYRIRTTNELFNLVYPLYVQEGAS